MNISESTMIEIATATAGAIIVCDTLAHCIACDDGLADKTDEIKAALCRGEDYLLGGGAAEGFVIRRAPASTIAR